MTQNSFPDSFIPQAVKKFYTLENEGSRLVFINGVQVYCLELADEVSCRHAAVQLYLCWKITQKEIASAWNVTVRTLNSWVKNYRATGIDGLKNKVQGPPVKISPELRRKVLKKRQKNWKVPDLCQHFSLSKSAVYRILEEHKKDSEKLLIDSDGGAESIDKHPTINSLSSHEVVEKLEVPDESGQIDPMDRSADRFYAQLGLLDDAVPVFAEKNHVEWAGAFLAVAMLSTSNFFECISKVFITIGPAFYGHRNVFMSFFLMAVLRIKNPEQLNRRNPQKLGRILGLDRAPSVKTLRRKIRILASRTQGVNLMTLLGKKRFEETKFPDAVLYVDGHVQCYYGKRKLGKTFSTTRNRALKATTDYWVNLGDGTALLCIPTEFNQSMSQILPGIVRQAKKLCKNKRLTIVFDRAGASAFVFEQITRLDCDFIAYNKNPKAIDLSLFKERETKINGKDYNYEPYDHSIEMAVYQKNSKGQYRKTGRDLKVREIIILRKDGGQTHLVTSRTDLDPVTVASTLFKRWTQENYFQYSKAMYDLDHVCVYKVNKVHPGTDHPNPEQVRLTKTLKTIRQRIGAIIGVAYEKLSENDLAVSTNQFQKLSPKKADELKQLMSNLKKTRQVLKETPERENAAEYERLEPESRLICNIVKMTAHHIEGKLAAILKHYWRGINGNERGMLDGFLQSTGAIKLKGKILQITLEKQATPERTQMLKRLCDDMTVIEAHYPGTNLRMVFNVQR